MYVNDDGNLLIELKYNDEIIEPSSTIIFNYLHNINLEMVFYEPTNDFKFSIICNFLFLFELYGILL